MCQYQKSRHGNILFIILILICFSFIIGRFTSLVILIKKFVYYISYPNISTANFIFRSAGNFAGNIRTIVSMHQENIAYKQKNQELGDKLRNYDAMSKEYDDLSKLLKLTKIKNTASVFARISVRTPNEWYQWFIIDKGEADGLYNEIPVVMLNKENDTLCVVGRIIETYKTSSKVALITNSICVLPVKVKGKDINCLAEGVNSNLLKITYIPQEADIKCGDEIVVSELSGVFQQDMPVGIITNILEEQSTDFKTATANTFFEKDTLYKAIVLVSEAEKK
ncbi:MAG: rod shape-determining protein MreC [Endomicrobium sp.]|jgi:rod shape-determining protein MreC|nr:rod shape-determining protein MreC [Endomicrobium sp.]